MLVHKREWSIVVVVTRAKRKRDITRTMVKRLTSNPNRRKVAVRVPQLPAGGDSILSDSSDSIFSIENSKESSYMFLGRIN